jgi:hypothetical protein
MNNPIHHRLWSLAQASLAIILFFGGSQIASAASVSADHIIRNTVSATYNDAGDIAQTPVSAFVNITVNLVAAAPSVARRDDLITQNGVTIDPSELILYDAVSLVYQISSNANGFDSYDFETTSATSLDGFAPLAISTETVDLASTVTSVGVGTVSAVIAITSITVAADSIGGGASLNGFIVGDFVKVGGGYCTVASITEPSVGSEQNATSTLGVNFCKADFGVGGPTGADFAGSAGMVAAGEVLGEVKLVTLNITATSPGLLSYTVSVDDTSNDPASTPVDVSDAITALSADLVIRKYVRNISNAAGNPLDDCSGVVGGCLYADTLVYFNSGVTTNPGDQLEYAILLYNNGGLVKAVKLTDPAVAFTTYVTQSARVVFKATAPDTCAVATDFLLCTVVGASGSTNLDSTATGPTSYIGSLLTAAAGHNADPGLEISPSTEAVGGSIYAGEASVVLFRIDVD